MYKQSPSRNYRSKGIRMKHVLQICLLIAVCFWLLYQVKRSHEKKREFDDRESKLGTNVQNGKGLKFGRKDITRVEEVTASDEKHVENDAENEVEDDESKPEEEEQEQEESQINEEDEARDDIDDPDPEKTEGDTEHEEETVDEERDREEEANERSEEVRDHAESDTVLDDQDHDGGGQDTREAREEHYKADDASSEVAHNTITNIQLTENVTTVKNSQVAEDGNSSNATGIIENKGSTHFDSKDNMRESSIVLGVMGNTTGLGVVHPVSFLGNGTQTESVSGQARNASTEQSLSARQEISLASAQMANSSVVTRTSNVTQSERLDVSGSSKANRSSESDLKSGIQVVKPENLETDLHSTNGGANETQTQKLNNNGSSGANESSDSEDQETNLHSTNEDVGAAQQDPIDVSDVSGIREEESQVDLGTLPEIRTKVRIGEDTAAE